MVPALCTLGLAVCGFGFLPRFTGTIAYGVLGWSFLIAMVSSGINLNHWLLDTSILQHIALVPAARVSWRTDAIVVALGAVTALLGAWRFKHRDLETE
jgi:ABC-2 type transport system permease protein